MQQAYSAPAMGRAFFFFRDGHIQFINEQAGALLPLLQPGTPGILPTVISQLVGEVKDVLKVKAGDATCEQRESRRIAGGGEHRFLIRAVGIPGNCRRNDSVLIIIETIRRNESLGE